MKCWNCGDASSNTTAFLISSAKFHRNGKLDCGSARWTMLMSSFLAAFLSSPTPKYYATRVLG